MNPNILEIGVDGTQGETLVVEWELIPGQSGAQFWQSLAPETRHRLASIADPLKILYQTLMEASTVSGICRLCLVRYRPQSTGLERGGEAGQFVDVLALESLAAEAVIKTDGWPGYSFLDAYPGLYHEWLVPGSGKEAPKVLPWAHALIANIKGNIRGIHHGVSPEPLPRYLAEFFYRFNRRFWEPQMFNRMLHACLNSATITFSELRI
ncbi:MAG: transposase [Deltaproteobacteria bacterium]|nr:transposase [Deltaproteobacteria bacterium]